MKNWEVLQSPPLLSASLSSLVLLLVWWPVTCTSKTAENLNRLQTMPSPMSATWTQTGHLTPTGQAANGNDYASLTNGKEGAQNNNNDVKFMKEQEAFKTVWTDNNFADLSGHLVFFCGVSGWILIRKFCRKKWSVSRLILTNLSSACPILFDTSKQHSKWAHMRPTETNTKNIGLQSLARGLSKSGTFHEKRVLFICFSCTFHVLLLDFIGVFSLCKP